MQTTDKRAMLISATALAVSVINIALTSPVLIEIYAKPRLTATEEHRQIDGDTFRTSFYVINRGFSGARAVEVILNAHPKDIFQVSPGVTAKIEEEPNGPPLKIVRVKLVYLAPDESFYILVTGAKEKLIEDSGNYRISDRAPVNEPIPAVVSVRSEKGLGSFLNQPAWYYVNAPTAK